MEGGGGAADAMWEGMELAPSSADTTAAPPAAAPAPAAVDILAGFKATAGDAGGGETAAGGSGGTDLLAMFNTSAAPAPTPAAVQEPAAAGLLESGPAPAPVEAGAAGVDPVQQALQKALHVRKADGSAQQTIAPLTMPPN